MQTKIMKRSGKKSKKNINIIYGVKILKCVAEITYAADRKVFSTL
jgi:hypothetical protein